MIMEAVLFNVLKVVQTFCHARTDWCRPRLKLASTEKRSTRCPGGAWWTLLQIPFLGCYCLSVHSSIAARGHNAASVRQAPRDGIGVLHVQAKMESVYQMTLSKVHAESLAA
ncbi:hypothetical protein DUNSADRAFT_14234 [Dunaliella salina]|uniref:Encoded protein n=1 Tax=Dunaliella salina TaxID=3046 RepID=A0ABQ7G7S3_DUNSA|nr:hypothetical protein DUNSADRAFT_14234 [Dunaliella salina]|eukprot:KAF5830634.1 hypothetical protein DUNSADRAFT_14234 [Dunaliella salina]